MLFSFVWLNAVVISCSASLFQRPEELWSRNGELNVTLEVTVARMTEGPFSWNRRSYDGLAVGRTWRVKPGDTLRVLLVNRLGTEEPDAIGQFLRRRQVTANRTGDWLHDFDMFNSPNHTNLHLHGMRVSPMANHDNIMRDCAPQENLSYVFHIPLDHPRGTFWYHPHVQGSGALQVASGMMGAIIVDDAPDDGDAQSTISLDHVPETTWVLHEVSHSHFPQKWNFLDNPLFYFGIDQPRFASGDRLPLDKVLDEKKYPSFKSCGGNKIWPNTSIWNIPQRFCPFDCAYVLVNGVFRPQIKARAGEWQRWRLIQSSHDSALRLQVDVGCEVMVIARDGWYYDDPKNVTRVPLVVPAGSRADLLVRCNSSGLFNVTTLTGGIHEGDFRSGEIPRELYQPVIYPQTIATINVQGQLRQLRSRKNGAKGPSAYSIRLPPRSQKSMLAAPVDRKYTVMYNLTGWGAEGRIPKVIGQFFNGGQFMINGKSFTNRTEHCMVQGEVEEWTIVSGHSLLDKWIHSFHIHQNWYQVVSQTEGVPNQLLTENLAYGEWRDTVQIPAGGSVTIRVQFNDILGVFPFHCHVSAHQDTGMMQLVQVVKTPEECPPGTLSPKLKVV